MMKPELFSRLVELDKHPVSLLTEKERQDRLILRQAMVPLALPCPHCGHKHSQAEAAPIDNPWTFAFSDEDYACPHTGEALIYNMPVLSGWSYWSRPPMVLPEEKTEG